MSTITLEEKCLYDASEWNPRGYCSRRRTGDDKLCTQHRKIQEARTARNARWAEEDARLTYIGKWRAAHPDDVYGQTWTCPLCRKVIQGQNVVNNARLQEWTDEHQQAHGQDWLDYEQAGRTPQLGQPDGGAG